MRTYAYVRAQAEREGRWWWEDAAAKECGLHSGNIQKNEDGSSSQVVDRDLWVDGPVEALSAQQVGLPARARACASVRMRACACSCIDVSLVHDVKENRVHHFSVLGASEGAGGGLV